MTTPYIPPARKFNLRILAFVAVFVVLLGTPVYFYIDTVLSGGIKKTSSGAYVVNLQAMSNFVFDQNNGTLTDVPQRWRELDGKRVIVDGEIAPGTLESRGVDHQFDLVYSVAKCCFSGAPQIQHFVQSSIPEANMKDVKWDLASRVRIHGTLKVDVTRDPADNRITGVYHLVVDKLETL